MPVLCPALRRCTFRLTNRIARLALLSATTAFASDLRVYTLCAYPVTAAHSKKIIGLEASTHLVSRVDESFHVVVPSAKAIARQRLWLPQIRVARTRLAHINPLQAQLGARAAATVQEEATEAGSEKGPEK